MKGRAVLKPEAESDLADAYAWYQRCRPGLGEEYLDEVESLLEVVCRAPDQFAVAYADLRIALV